MNDEELEPRVYGASRQLPWWWEEVDWMAEQADQRERERAAAEAGDERTPR